MKTTVTSNQLSVISYLRRNFLLFVLSLLLSTVYCLLSTFAYAKVYIDITSPAFKKLPIAIHELAGTEGKEISDIIRDDLDFTGLFFCLDRNAYIENPGQPFNPRNWTVLGAEAVVKGTVKGEQNLIVTVSLYDVFEGREIFKKEYQAEKALIRPLSHSIANDIYNYITGDNGIFRTRIAFVAEDENGNGLYIMDWDGSRVDRLGIKGSLVLTPRWSKDGTKLLYSSERNRQWGVYLLNFVKMTERRIFSSKGTNMAGDFFPGGDEIVLSSSSDGTPDLYIFKISESKLTKLTSTRGIDVSPTVSPDGNSIAFVSDRGGSPQIYIMNRDGYDARRLTFEGSYNTSPSWSPKGDRIVFVGRRGGKNQIFTIKPDSSALTQLTDRGNNEDPSFSPDGRFIAFSSDRDGQKGIYIMRANGESQKRITPKGLRAFGPRWSPN